MSRWVETGRDGYWTARQLTLGMLIPFDLTHVSVMWNLRATRITS